MKKSWIDIGGSPSHSVRIGILADPARGFTTEHSARVLSLVQTPGLAEEIGQSARRCVERGYSWEANLQPLGALLNAGVPPERVVGVRS